MTLNEMVHECVTSRKSLIVLIGLAKCNVGY